MRTKTPWLAMATLGVSAIAMGCNGNKVDCAQVCAAYADCVDSDVDVPECTRSCEDRADESQNREDRLEQCEACIEGMSCAESTLACTDDCAGVIDPDTD